METCFSAVDDPMGINLQLLGLQAIPRLAEKFDVKLNGFSGFLDLYGTSPEDFHAAFGKCGEILEWFFGETDVSWWDVYSNSDIGMERMALARDIGLDKEDRVLDVGCGRGYFTIAATTRSRRVVGLDAMNGMGRHGWWKNFKESIRGLQLGSKVLPLKADAVSIPLRDCSMDKAVAVHCIRNFQNRQLIQNALREMNRVLSEGGRIDNS